jgi:hypothetical protein
MPNIKVGFKGKTIFYDIDGGGCGEQYIYHLMTDGQLTYAAIIFGLNEFFIKWQKELDARAYDVGEDKSVAQKVADPAVFTKRELPPPTYVIIEDNVVYEELAKLREPIPLHKKQNAIVKQMIKNLRIKFKKGDAQ